MAHSTGLLAIVPWADLRTAFSMTASSLSSCDERKVCALSRLPADESGFELKVAIGELPLWSEVKFHGARSAAYGRVISTEQVMPDGCSGACAVIVLPDSLPVRVRVLVGPVACGVGIISMGPRDDD